jgi:hypothetical protein
MSCPVSIQAISTKRTPLQSYQNTTDQKPGSQECIGIGPNQFDNTLARTQRGSVNSADTDHSCRTVSRQTPAVHILYEVNNLLQLVVLNKKRPAKSRAFEPILNVETSISSDSDRA